MFSNNKFLGKCWYVRHPWIRLAMESESMVEKGISFIFYLETTYDISSMESIENYSIVFVDRKCMPHKQMIRQRQRITGRHLAQRSRGVTPSPEMKNEFTLCCLNKLLGKCWYGRHPWIRLAMESESMVEKE